jgi:hypothetical protein
MRTGDRVVHWLAVQCTSCAAVEVYPRVHGRFIDIFAPGADQVNPRAGLPEPTFARPLRRATPTPERGPGSPRANQRAKSRPSFDQIPRHSPMDLDALEMRNPLRRPQQPLRSWLKACRSLRSRAHLDGLRGAKRDGRNSAAQRAPLCKIGHANNLAGLCCDITAESGSDKRVYGESGFLTALESRSKKCRSSHTT